jgi:hypothetical protein
MPRRITDTKDPSEETKRERRLRMKREQGRLHYAENREKRSAEIKSYYQANKEKAAAYHKEWTKQNPNWQKDYNAANKEHQAALKSAYKKERPEINWKSYLKCTHGLTVERYNEMLGACNGRCPICRNPFDDRARRPCVDHCHGTGMVRGILCSECNKAEGVLGTIENVRRLLAYMENFELLYVAPKTEAEQTQNKRLKPKRPKPLDNVLPFLDEQVA